MNIKYKALQKYLLIVTLFSVLGIVSSLLPKSVSASDCLDTRIEVSEGSFLTPALDDSECLEPSDGSVTWTTLIEDGSCLPKNESDNNYSCRTNRSFTDKACGSTQKKCGVLSTDCASRTLSQCGYTDGQCHLIDGRCQDIYDYSTDASEVINQLRSQRIYECTRAGVSGADCNALLVENPNAILSGAALANCIFEPSGKNCQALKGLDNIKTSYQNCTGSNVEGSCVDGRTCIYGGGKVLRNIGAYCGVRANVSVMAAQVRANQQSVSVATPPGAMPQVAVTVSTPELGTACSSSRDWLSRDGKAGDPCCGGGNNECLSGICNADKDKRGVCAAVPTGSTVAGLGSSEATTGVSTETRTEATDCSKANGIVQGTPDSGFVLKCDFDANGSFGFHQPTGFITGGGAVVACQTLCADPTADVEETAHTSYTQSRAAASAASTNTTTVGAKPLTLADLRCKPPMYESEFACVAQNKFTCVKDETEECYRRATQIEQNKVCDKPYQLREADCRVQNKGETCLRHPKTGCFETKADVYAANAEYAQEIAAGQEEIKVTVTVTRNIFQKGLDVIKQGFSTVTTSWNTFWSNLGGGATTEMPATTGTSGTENTTAESDSDENTMPPAATVVISDELVLLNGGRGLSTGAEMNSGNMEVEGYCNRVLGRNHANNNNRTAWSCDDDTHTSQLFLSQAEFTRICALTYTTAENVVARQTGNDANPIFNWRCYGTPASSN